jgi:hypothetical protein
MDDVFTERPNLATYCTPTTLSCARRYSVTIIWRIPSEILLILWCLVQVVVTTCINRTSFLLFQSHRKDVAWCEDVGQNSSESWVGNRRPSRRIAVRWGDAQSLNNSSDERAKLKAMCNASTCLEQEVMFPRLVFCKEPEYALPLIRLPRHDSRVQVYELKQMIHGDVEEIVGSVYLMCDVVCLDSEENIYWRGQTIAFATHQDV